LGQFYLSIETQSPMYKTYKKNQFLILIIFNAIILTSCVSQKEITYFQSNEAMGDNLEMVIDQNYIAKIQTGDILGIYVSSLSPEASAMFNPFSSTQIAASMSNQNIQSNAPIPATGFLVDDNGNIVLPLIGKIKLGGKTTKDATDIVKNMLDTYLQQPTVNIRILNFKISVLGEVTRPSVYTVPNEKITLTEALSLAGDLTIHGKRTNVLIIRETDGKKEFSRIDLTKRDVFNSPYYYLHPNDVIYVEPGKGKTTATDRTVQLAPLVISALTLVTVLLTNIL
jgi:polysaccharide export outer membrane protein